MFRITSLQADRDPERTTLRLEGRLTAASLSELSRLCASFRGRPGQLQLDLTGITYLDDAAVTDLRRLMRERVCVTGGSSFIRELLQER